MNPTIPHDAIGETLRSVFALIFDVPNEDGPPNREAISLHFDDLRITIRAMTDTSELSVDTKELSAPDNPEMAGCYRITDISDHQLVASFIGKRVFDWWSLTNDAGYRDGVMITFSSYDALCCIAMNNEVSILNAAGEQCA